MRSQKSVFENNHWKNITPHAIINTHWMITNAGTQNLLLVQTPTVVGGLRIYRISTLLLVIVLSLQPPIITAVFLLTNNKKQWRYKMILVDNSYIGRRISSARKTANIKRNDAARMLRITPKKLLRYESGKELIPEFVLERLFYSAWAMMAVRNAKIKK